MIEIVFSGSAYGGLATASSSHPENIERMKVEARKFGVFHYILFEVSCGKIVEVKGCFCYVLWYPDGAF